MRNSPVSSVAADSVVGKGKAVRRTPSRSERIVVSGLDYHVRHWGRKDRPILVLLHGWMDTSSTFQFVVDALTREWHVIAPDWRGYGATAWLARPYWFPDYLADLDALLRRYLPEEPARIVGHSMGASIAATYAGVRPDRVARLVMLDFLGLPRVDPGETPVRLGHWLEGLASPPEPRTYADYGDLARRLRFVNPRLTPERADFLARRIGMAEPGGRVTLACDPWHRVPSALPYRIEEAMACWRSVTAPARLLVADQGFVVQRFGRESDELAQRMACFASLEREEIPDCGHNLHHDQPERVAASIEAFLTG